MMYLSVVLGLHCCWFFSSFGGLSLVKKHGLYRVQASRLGHLGSAFVQGFEPVFPAWQADS